MLQVLARIIAAAARALRTAGPSIRSKAIQYANSATGMAFESIDDIVKWVSSDRERAMILVTAAVTAGVEPAVIFASSEVAQLDEGWQEFVRHITGKGGSVAGNKQALIPHESDRRTEEDLALKKLCQWVKEAGLGNVVELRDHLQNLLTLPDASVNRARALGWL